jgi:hypothetical protein
VLGTSVSSIHLFEHIFFALAFRVQFRMSLVPRLVEMYQCDKGRPLNVEGGECRRCRNAVLAKEQPRCPQARHFLKAGARDYATCILTKYTMSKYFLPSLLHNLESSSWHHHLRSSSTFCLGIFHSYRCSSLSVCLANTSCQLRK